MRKTILQSLVLLLLGCPMIGAAQNDPEFNIKAFVADIEKRYEACPRREIVAAFDRKHHKQIWQKSGWGPPAQVFADAKANDSILYPYIVTVEFYLSFTYGPERQSKAEAENDSNLSPLGVPLAAAQGGRYRNVYLVSAEGTRLKATEFFETQSDGATDTWNERPLWPNACWDQIR
jgi:hypothetical protein